MHPAQQHEGARGAAVSSLLASALILAYPSAAAAISQIRSEPAEGSASLPRAHAPGAVGAIRLRVHGRLRLGARATAGAVADSGQRRAKLEPLGKDREERYSDGCCRSDCSDIECVSIDHSSQYLPYIILAATRVST